MSVDAPQLHPSSCRRKRFVVVPENRSAVMALRRFAKICLSGSARQEVVSLFLRGDAGCGKTHLVDHLLRTVIGRKPHQSVRLIAGRELARIVSDSRSHGQPPMREFHRCDLLIVEDVQHLPHAAARILETLIDYRGGRQLPTAFTSTFGPAALPDMPPRLVSRLAAGLVVSIDPFSRESRHKLANRLCKQRGLYVTLAVEEWLAAYPSSSVRQMLGEINRLEELSRHRAPPLDLPTVEADLLPLATAPTLERLLAEVAGHFGVTVKLLRARDRHRRLLWPRQVGMYLARRLTGLSLPRIGACFGGFDHSTVLHSCRKVERQLIADAGLARVVATLTAKVT